tara:strand:+ start:483 stop:815 length:333 start_codon:yes stop_codon:yes gene_type:complete
MSYDYGFDLPDVRSTYHIRQPLCDNPGEDDWEYGKVTVTIRREYYSEFYGGCDYHCYFDVDGDLGRLQGYRYETSAEDAALALIQNSDWEHDTEAEDFDAVCAAELAFGC